MYYNIVLNSLNKKTDPQALKIISKLACENRDLIEARTFPTIICRYATPDEVSFYKELQEKYSLDLVFKEIKTADNVFELFNAELKQGEQEDIHLKDKPEIINRLQDGLDVLEEKEACEDDFKLSSEMIKSKIRDELREHGIGHVTIELENEDEHCQERYCRVSAASAPHHCHHHHH